MVCTAMLSALMAPIIMTVDDDRVATLGEAHDGRDDGLLIGDIEGKVTQRPRPKDLQPLDRRALGEILPSQHRANNGSAGADGGKESGAAR